MEVMACFSAADTGALFLPETQASVISAALLVALEVLHVEWATKLLCGTSLTL